MTKKKTIHDLYDMKVRGEKAAWITAYDYCFASYAEEAGMDMILVGDSVGMIVYGYNATNPVTMDMCINHCQAVRRGALNTYIIGDMPFGSYHESTADAIHNAIRFIKEADVDAIKLEGGVSVADKIKAITQAGIVVFAHIGLTPQSSAAMGGFRVQGRTVEGARTIVEDAIAVYEAGSKFILIEGVPEEVCEFIHELLPIPVYGIGAGSKCDGQVLVIGDALGLYKNFTPKFVKKYTNIAEITTKALSEYIDEVKTAQFPGESHRYIFSEEKDDLNSLFCEIKKKHSY